MSERAYSSMSSGRGLRWTSFIRWVECGLEGGREGHTESASPTTDVSYPVQSRSTSPADARGRGAGSLREQPAVS